LGGGGDPPPPPPKSTENLGVADLWDEFLLGKRAPRASLTKIHPSIKQCQNLQVEKLWLI
jgi:hypothetical protein